MKARFAAAEAKSGEKPSLEGGAKFDAELRADLVASGLPEAAVGKALAYARKTAYAETDEATYQAMEALIHNLNTMHSRAGAQTPFSSINYGTDTSAEGRMIVRNILLRPSLWVLGTGRLFEFGLEAPEMFRVLGKRRPDFVRPYIDELKNIADTDSNRVVRIHCLGALKTLSA